MRRSWKKRGRKRVLKRNIHTQEENHNHWATVDGENERYEMIHTHCSRRAWPASIVYVEMVVGSRIDSTFASLPPMVRATERTATNLSRPKFVLERYRSFAIKLFGGSGYKNLKLGRRDKQGKGKWKKLLSLEYNSSRHWDVTRICWFQSNSRDVDIKYL